MAYTLALHIKMIVDRDVDAWCWGRVKMDAVTFIFTGNLKDLASVGGRNSETFTQTRSLRYSCYGIVHART
ncbi:unnamed protein product [Sphenostylis stenocarpa]|uniref:Uncharacterized protein n=1 Tax=Sphenostylis stenocarpa TaxID=92480 RepID=A0AA86VQ21_9FABA|nr:unnamed protein product [Sphenostylis stenocarpa]